MRRLKGGFVDLRIDRFAFHWIFFVPVLFKKRFDPVQQGLLLFPVQRGDPGGAFEHHVLKIVCQTGGALRIIQRTGMDQNIALDPGLIRILCQDHGQTVFQFDLVETERIAGSCLKLFRREKEDRQNEQKQ